MKTKAFLTLTFLLFSFPLLFSQVPLRFNYQAVARNDAGQVLKNEALTIKIGIISGSIDSTLQWEETHDVTTNDYGLFTIEIGGGTRTGGAISIFTDVDWTASPYFLNVQVDQTGSYVDMGTTQLLSVPYALNAASVTSLKNLTIMEEIDNVSDSAALFEVKNKDGNTVFAVYNEGVRVYVDTVSSKGPKGGFAVGGFSSSKNTGHEYLRVTPDSVRVYIDETVSKGLKGGFAVGGFSPGKSGSSSFMHMTPDNYFIGHQSGSSITTGLYNSFFGYQSGFSNNVGDRNVFLGYKTGYSNTEGNYNTFIGSNTGYNNIDGEHNIFLGFASGYNNTTAGDNIFIGNWAGYYNKTGIKNVFQGYQSGAYNDTGSYNVFIGNYSGRENTYGNFNTFLGTYSGRYNTEGKSNVAVGQRAGTDNTTGNFNVFLGTLSGADNTKGEQNVYLGQQAGYNDSIGNYNVMVGSLAGNFNYNGSSNVFLGYNAGYWETGSNKLYIDNSSAGSTDALIYGDFNSDELRFNADVGINSAPSAEYDLYIAGNAYATGSFWEPSDIKLKTKIQTIEGAISNIRKLRGVTYEYKQDIKSDVGLPTGTQIGVIAQEVQELFPELVKEDTSGNLAVDYMKFSAIFIEAFKEQQKMIEDLQERIAVLEAENKTP